MSVSIPHTSGIYKIICLPTGKIYVGSAINISARWQGHRSSLRLGKHHSRHLQNAWNKYGEAAFQHEVIELVLSSFLLEREQYWLDRLRSFDPDRGFNRSPTAGTTAGTPRSVEHRAKLSEVAKKRMADPERRAAVSRVHTGKTMSDEHKAAIHDKLGGTTRPQHVIDAVVNAHAMNFVVVDPDGKEYRIRNLAAFCRDQGLDRRSMLGVAQGRGKQYKGWKCRYDISD